MTRWGQVTGYGRPHALCPTALVGRCQDTLEKRRNTQFRVRSGMAFATVASVLTGLLFRVLPAWRMSRFDPLLALREGSHGTAGRAPPAQVPSQSGTSLGIGQGLTGESTTALVSSSNDPRPITAKQRVAWVIIDTLGPHEIIGEAFSAGLATWKDTPTELGSHWDGFGARA
jgi:hypothetical protein